MPRSLRIRYDKNSYQLFLSAHCILHSIQPCGQADQHIVIVGLIAFHGGFVAHRLAAFVAAMDDDKALFRIGKGLYGTENALAGVGSVARIYIYMERAKAEGTVISRGVAEGLYLSATVLADETVVVFLKSLVFHNITC